MSWSRTPPTEPGWYWARVGGRNPEVVLVRWYVEREDPLPPLIVISALQYDELAIEDVELWGPKLEPPA